jgi:hypothetical protein
MNVRRFLMGAALLAATALPCTPSRAADLDIKRIAPTNSHTFVYAKKNSERDYQAKYLADAWKTFRDERIAERVFELISSRAPKDELEKFTDAWEQVQTALAPINVEALAEAEEFAMFNIMIGPFGHTVVAVRLSEEDAKEYREGTGNLFALVKKWSDGKATPEESEASGADITTLRLPEKVPYQPAVACQGDLFLISTSEDVLKTSLALLNDSSAKTKFDDERLKEALSELPKAEDAITFFDGNQLFASMGELGDFIRKENPGEEKAERAAKLVERIVKEVDILEFEASVQFTEEGQNRIAALGKASDSLKESILGRAITSGEPFEDWQSWVPADARAYSLSTGINLHEIYSSVLSFVREEVPESQEGLDKWNAMQEKVGVNLDQDILQAFSGENVSITLSDQQTVTALKCSNPEKIRELMDRAIEGLKQIPQVQQQGLDLVDCEDEALDGFQELRVAALAMTPAKPVIGFHDGWMIFASSPAAAKKLLAVRAGDEKSIKGAETLEKFDLDVDGTVNAVSYSDIGATVRATADGIDQFAVMAPMIVGAAAQGAKPEDMKAIQQAIGLLPSVAKVIRKFDFYEQKLSITRPGPMKGSYKRETVVMIRQPSTN